MPPRRDSSLTVTVGPMWAGKTEALDALIRHLAVAGQGVVLFRPKGDRPGPLVTHAGRQVAHPATFYDPADTRRPHLPPGTTHVIVDEVQRFSTSVSRWVEFWVSRGIRVSVFGLDMDSDGEVYSSVAELLAKAETIVKLVAVCRSCHGDATRTARLDNEPARTQVGAEDLYEPLCTRCWFTKRASR